MDSSQILEKIDRDGFCIVPKIVSPQQIPSLKKAIDEALLYENKAFGKMPGKIPNLAVDLAARGGEFWHLLGNEKMRQIFAAVLGDACILYSFTSTVLYPQDKPPAAEIHVDSPRLSGDYNLGLLMTLALDDFTEENGSTFYLPGSHRQNSKPDPDTFYKNAVRVSRSAGDAVFFHPRVWHAAGGNLTQQVRYGCTIYACRSFMRQRFDYVRMIGERLHEAPDSVRAFLGGNVRVPSSLAEFYVAAEHRLYKPNQG